MENLFTIISPELLRIHRTIKKKIQADIARILGVDRTTYNGYEKLQELKLHTKQAEELAKFLGIEVADLQPKVEKVPRGNTDGIIPIHREVWQELKENNKTYKEFLHAYKDSFNALIQTVNNTMENLSKQGNRKNW